MSRILVAFDFWRVKREFIAFLIPMLAALYFPGIIVTINMNPLALFAAMFADFLIAPVKVRPAAINVYVLVITDVRAVDRPFEDVDVGPPVDNACAAAGV